MSDCSRAGCMLDVQKHLKMTNTVTGKSHTIQPLVVPERSIFLGYYRNALFKFTSESGLSISSADI